MASGVSIATKLADSHVPLGKRSALISVGESSDVVGGGSGGGGGAGTQVAPGAHSWPVAFDGPK